MNWRSVKKELPLQSGWYWVCTGHFQKQDLFIIDKHLRIKRWKNDSEFAIKVKFWAYIPCNPKEKQK